MPKEIAYSQRLYELSKAFNALSVELTVHGPYMPSHIAAKLRGSVQEAVAISDMFLQLYRLTAGTEKAADL